MRTVALGWLSLILWSSPAVSLAAEEDGGCLLTADGDQRMMQAAKKVYESCRIIVTLPEPPPSRVRCTLVGNKGGHYELEWESGGAPSLAQAATLRPDTWKLICGADPFYPPTAPMQTQTSTNAAWRFDPSNSKCDSDKCTLPLAKPSGREIRYRRVELQSLSEVVANLGTVGGGQSGGRSLELVLSPAVAEAFQILAEIALERARAGALRKIQGELRDLICVQLTTNKIFPTLTTTTAAQADKEKTFRETFGEAWKHKTTTVILSGGDDVPHLLPNTCSAIESIRLHDLVQDADTLYRALAKDVVAFVAQVAQTSLELAWTHSQPPEAVHFLKPFFESAERLLKASIDGRSLDLRREAQVLITTVAGQVSRRLDTLGKDTPASTELCSVALVLAAAAECHASKECDARAISGYVLRAKWFFNFTTVKQCLAVSESAGDLAPLVQLASRTVELMNLSSDAKPRDALLLALHLGFDLAGIMTKELSFDPQELRLSPRRAFELYESAGAALIEGDVSTFLVAAGEVAIAYSDDELSNPHLVKLTKLIGGLLAFARAYTGPELDKLDAEEKKEARKKAIEAVIDAYSDRSDLSGRNVFGVGVPAGLRLVGGSRVEGFLTPSLSLPLGLGYQRLPAGDWSLAGHVFLYPIDVGQFLPSSSELGDDAPKWNAFLTPGAQLAFLIGTPEDLFFVGVDYHVADRVRTAQRTPFSAALIAPEPNRLDHRVSLVAGYYVPLLDLVTF